MSISPRTVTCDADNLWVELSDGSTIGMPLAWFPRLLATTPAQRATFELSPQGIHWKALDEDISIDGLLAGTGISRAGGERWPEREALSVFDGCLLDG